MGREEMKKIAADTMDCVEKGNYRVSGKIIVLPVPPKGVLLPPGQINKLLKERTYLESNNCKYEVRNQKTVDSILERANLGGMNKQIGVLNFASAYNPGGGFLNGATAQEESLAYCSNLYHTLQANEMYTINKQNRSPLYSDYMIVSEVTFFKDSRYNYLENPVTVRVVTTPAVNLGEVKKQKRNIQEAKGIMKERMRKILEVFAVQGCSTLILGAYGCGVFGNDAEEVVNNWYDLLMCKNYSNNFKHIIFAVYDTKKVGDNYNVFNKKFQ